MECWLCIRSQKDGFLPGVDCKGIKHVAECTRPTDKIPKRSKDNRRFWQLFKKIRPGLVKTKRQLGIDDGKLAMFKTTEFDYTSIETTFNNCCVPAAQRPALHDKCVAVINVIIEIEAK